MELLVTLNKVYGDNSSTSSNVVVVNEKKTVELAGRKAEKKVPVKKWFRVVGHKFVMYRRTTLAITPQSITNEGVSFTISSDVGIQPHGTFTMVKNSKKGDVYILGKGESIAFRTSLEKNYEEIILSIKE